MIESKYDHFKEQIISREIPDTVLAEMIGCSISAISSARFRFLNPQRCASYQKQWRKEHPKKVRDQIRKYHKQFRDNDENKGAFWTITDNKLILEGRFSDRELSEKLQRPVSAIQRQRCTLKKR